MKKEAKMHGVWWFIATWFGTGLSPVVSGTVGSFAALPFAYYIHIHFGGGGLFIASILMFIAGVWASNTYLRIKGGTDPSEIVADEVAGQWLILSVLAPTWHAYLVGFIVFRIFDIIKPWPVSWADQNVPGGLGVMLDDMMASLFAILLGLLAYKIEWLGLSGFIEPLLP